MAAAQATRDALNLRQDNVNLQSLNKWGLMPQEMVTCSGSTVKPKDALKEQMKRMKLAMLGPQIGREDCNDEYRRMMATIVMKRNVLAQVLGTSRTDFKTCDGKGDKDKACMGEVMDQFEKLRAQVYTSSGKVKSEFQPAIAILRGYGSSGRSSCTDLNYCTTEVQEDYVRSWSRRYRKNKRMARLRKKKFGPDAMRPPAYIDPKAAKSVAASFEFEDRRNPLYSEFKK